MKGVLNQTVTKKFFVNEVETTDIVSVDEDARLMISPYSTVQVEGDTAHSGVDSGNPIKIGAVGYNMDPGGGGKPGPAAVADGDRVNIVADKYGRLVTATEGIWYGLSDLNTTYNNLITERVSSDIKAYEYRKATVGLTIQSISTPQTIQIIPQCSPNGADWYDMENGPLGLWIYEDTAFSTAQAKCITFDIAATFIRIKIVATGTNSSKRFVVTKAILYMRT